ncbi:MAG: ATP-binding protein [Actinomycetota bacterium]
MIFTRKIFRKLRKSKNTPEVVVVTGMRRVGKTTALTLIFKEIKSKNKVFLDLTNPLNQEIFTESDYENIWANLAALGINKKEKAYIFLDEVQIMPEITNVVKYFYDHHGIKFFLTGSSSFYLKNLFPESLSGRKILYHLLPLDFEEFLIFKKFSKPFYDDFSLKDKNKNKMSYEKTKKLYQQYMEYGGFPQVVLEESTERKKLWLEDIFKSYFEKDVQALSDFRQIGIFRKLIFLLMQRAGQKIEIGKLSAELGVSRPTIYSYIRFLEDTFFIDLISPFSKNVDREVSGAKKIYLCDNGILNHFARISHGNLFENSVYLNLKKYGEINYYQKRKGGKIDFIIEDLMLGLECKQTGTDSDYSRVQKVARMLNLKQSYILTENFNKSRGFIPAAEL